MLYHPNIRRGQHIKVNGTQCGSPAVRRNSFCYFHGRWREQRILLGNTRPKAIPSLDLPVLEDANSIQVAIMQVMTCFSPDKSNTKPPACFSTDCKPHPATCAVPGSRLTLPMLSLIPLPSPKPGWAKMSGRTRILMSTKKMMKKKMMPKRTKTTART
jgi:hypothetical protein